MCARSMLSKTVSVAAMNSLIAACGRGHRPDLALAVLYEMEAVFRLRPDERSYRSAVVACNQAQHDRMRRRRIDETESEDIMGVEWWECAVSLLRRMKESGLNPDVQTFSSAISACESAGEWQRALGILQTMMDASAEEAACSPKPNLYCFNAAISACEKGGAWVEAVDLYERMLNEGGSLKPNFVTLNSLIVALEKSGQKELAQSKFIEGTQLQIVNPWRKTSSGSGERVNAMVRRNCRGFCPSSIAYLMFKFSQ